MKREAVGTTKMKRLCKLLNVRLYVAVGIMESLWHLTAREAPQGDIGKLSDEDIALGIDWDGPPEELVGALVKARWMDESGAHRLIVHDWHQHADDAVDVRLGRAILLYANGAQPRMTRLSKEEKVKLCALYAHSVRTESHEKPLPVPVPVPLPEPVPVPVPGGSANEPPPEPVLAELDLDDEEANIPDDLPAPVMGNYILQRLSIPHSHGLAAKFADCATLLARDEGKTRGKGAQALLLRARDHPPDNGKWRFWLEDGSWKAQASQGISTEGWE